MKIQTQHIVYLEDARYMQCSCYVVLASVSTKDRRATRDIKRRVVTPTQIYLINLASRNIPAYPGESFVICIFSSSFIFSLRGCFSFCRELCVLFGRNCMCDGIGD